ncbi:anthrax toxin lethal factor-related metalloendopeptidase [Neobacillus citreus]|uniref:Toxin n=1 Tax=Neobacillus citreus TaxID=2833578 RepID=A0A942YD13_9BACI|nr:toxin [Neobacillus citreus]MCH6269214.1 toxin [Neobacillus citreus]
MRKWVIFFLIVTLSLVSVTTSKASINGMRIIDFPKNSQLYESIKISPNNVNQIIFLPPKTFDEKEAAKIINRFGSLPNSLLSKIYQNGITLKLFTGKLTDNPTARQLKGKIPRGYPANTTWDDVPGIGGGKVVLVKIGASDKGKGHGSINLELHEMAHSIDHIILSNVSQTKEFKTLMENEHEKLFPGKSYFEYPEEYFAESFSMYFLNSESKAQLKWKAPETYYFFKNLF